MKWLLPLHTTASVLWLGTMWYWPRAWDFYLEDFTGITWGLTAVYFCLVLPSLVVPSWKRLPLHVTDLSLKLGLLGTLIGFLIMMQGIGALDFSSGDINLGLIAAVSDGMAIALHTSIAGFTVSILAALTAIGLGEDK